MIKVHNPSNDPAYNLALEEYLVKLPSDHFLGERDLFMFWQNRPVVVVGRNQNTDLQLNREFIHEQGIDVVRRLSGGGAVYHDDGNLNFTIIKRGAHSLRNDFSFFTQPVLEALLAIGVQGEFAGRNDLVIEGQKFSGNAQYVHHDTLLHHGTILWNSDMSVLGQALRAKKRLARGVESVVSRVTNVAPYAGETSLSDFQEHLTRAFTQFGDGQGGSYELSDIDKHAVEEIAQNRYRTASWNWGNSPQFNWVKEATLSAGNMLVCADVEDGVLRYVKIYGDFFEAQPIETLESELEGRRVEALGAHLATLDLESYVHRLALDQLLDLLELR